ncbi:MAG: cytochrome B5 [Chloroflexota bacterium]
MQQLHIDEYERRWLTISAVMLGVFFATLLAGAAIFGVTPAGQGGFVNPQHLNETEFANPGVRHMGENRYEVIIIGQAWSFSPSSITIPEGAEVTFRTTSRDIIHGFFIEHHNVSFEMIPGHVAETRVNFEEAGEFKILCSQYCGRAHHAMHATINVLPAEEFVASAE